MKQKINSLKKPVLITFDIVSDRPCTFNVTARDANVPKPLFCNKLIRVDSVKKNISLQLPDSPNTLEIDVLASNKDSGVRYRIENFKESDLKVLPNYLSERPFVKSFMSFVREFVDNVYIKGIGLYTSDDGAFRISVENVLKDDKGNDLTTSMYADGKTRVIHVSLPKIHSYNRAEIIAVLCHEFSHLFVNHNPANEIDADFNAIKIYLGNGYAEADIIKVFSKIFYNRPTELNMNRMKLIEREVLQYRNMRNLMPNRVNVLLNLGGF